MWKRRLCRHEIRQLHAEESISEIALLYRSNAHHGCWNMRWFPPDYPIACMADCAFFGAPGNQACAAYLRLRRTLTMTVRCCVLSIPGTRHRRTAALSILQEAAKQNNTTLWARLRGRVAKCRLRHAHRIVRNGPRITAPRDIGPCAATTAAGGHSK